MDAKSARILKIIGLVFIICAIFWFVIAQAVMPALPLAVVGGAIVLTADQSAKKAKR